MSQELIGLSHRIAAAIAARDLAALAAFLADGFVHRTHGGAASDAAQFVAAIRELPGEIAFVRLEQLVVDERPGWALVTGVQHARVSVDGQTIDDRRGFVDWFVRRGGDWRLQAAVDLPAAE
jgi:ketosteroid isomerase-like protein